MEAASPAHYDVEVETTTSLSAVDFDEMIERERQVAGANDQARQAAVLASRSAADEFGRRVDRVATTFLARMAALGRHPEPFGQTAMREQFGWRGRRSRDVEVPSGHGYCIFFERGGPDSYNQGLFLDTQLHWWSYRASDSLGSEGRSSSNSYLEIAAACRRLGIECDGVFVESVDAYVAAAEKLLARKIVDTERQGPG